MRIQSDFSIQRAPCSSVLQTLAFFDVFSHPLTQQELLRLQWHNGGSMSGEEIYNDLHELMEKGRIVRAGGFYTLQGSHAAARERNRRLKLVEKKMRVARRAARFARCVPFVRAMFVCNTVALGVPRAESDVDVFIVMRGGRLWLSRLLVTALLSVRGLRRHRSSIADKVCLSFYITDDSLDIGRIAKEQPDIYLIYWLAHLIPVYDPECLHARIMRENAWALAWTPCALTEWMLHRRWAVRDGVFSRAVRRAGKRMLSGAAGGYAERAARSFQRWHMRRNSGSIQDEPDTRVVIDDTMLKFHENDRRAFFKSEWRARCQRVGV